MECPGICFPWYLHGIIGKKGNWIWARVLLSVKVLKNGMPDHIFLSSFHDSCTQYHGEGGEQGNTWQGFQHCTGLEKMECPGIFFPWYLHGIIGKKGNWIWARVLLSVKVLKNGMRDHIFLSSFHDSCTQYHGEGGGNKEIRGRVFSTVQVWKKWNVLAFVFHDTCTVSLGKKEIKYGSVSRGK